MSFNRSRLNSAMFGIPSNYKESREKYKKDLQAKIDETWWISPNTFEIKKELIHGTQDLSDFVCRVINAINPKTGLNRGDDYKQLLFFDLDDSTSMGDRFFFDDSWWVVTNTDNYKHMTKSAVVRRCNNILRWVMNATIVTEPCVVDYSMKYSNLYYNNVIDIPTGTIVIICQYNEFTSKIDINDRFILGEKVYKIKTVESFLRQKTNEASSTPIILFTAFIDSIAPDDDFVNQIAQKAQYNQNESELPPAEDGVEIVVSPTDDYILLGHQQKYSCSVFVNGVEQDEPFTFNASGVPDENFDLVVVDSKTFVIKNKKAYSPSPLSVNISCVYGEKTILCKLKGLY